MKQALCVQSFDQLSTLISATQEAKDSGNVPSIEAKMVSRDVCENPENGYQQLIPYVTIYAVEPEEGKLMFIQYQRADIGEGDDRLQGKTSIGFGGHIDSDEDISAQETIIDEDGITSYKMTLQDIIDTGFKCAVREIKEELDIDLFDFGVNVYNGETAFFLGDLSEEVNTVHLGFSIQIETTPEKFEEIKAASKFNEDEIKKIETFGVNLNVIVEEMDITNTTNRIIHSLKNEYNLEDWSCRIFGFILRNVINKLLHSVTYKDMIYIANLKKADLDKEEVQAA